MTAEIKALLEECARQRGSLLLQLDALNRQFNEAKAEIDKRNQLLQVALFHLDAAHDHWCLADDRDNARQVDELQERIAALGGSRLGTANG